MKSASMSTLISSKMLVLAASAGMGYPPIRGDPEFLSVVGISHVGSTGRGSIAVGQTMRTWNGEIYLGIYTGHPTLLTPRCLPKYARHGVPWHQRRRASLPRLHWVGANTSMNTDSGTSEYILLGSIFRRQVVKKACTEATGTVDEAGNLLAEKGGGVLHAANWRERYSEWPHVWRRFRRD
ncbi:hypothetical protein R3P38DRAFT_1846467 [Favolaschia claudopus]|uniref:Uncharacterized protein n=1 Tax=Favolaschia claudopus TaxID=2862362 RepID=A0AAW0A2U0_9AGAR